MTLADVGCARTREVLDAIAELTLGRFDPARLYPEAVAHLRACAACSEELEKRLAAPPG